MSQDSEQAGRPDENDQADRADQVEPADRAGQPERVEPTDQTGSAGHADAPRPLLMAIIRSAVENTAATAGWILARRGDRLVIVAASGGSPQWAASLVGRSTSLGSGTASYVVQSGQPVAIQPGTGSLSDDIGTELLARTPVSLVCVPCTTDEQAVGALQLVDKLGGGPFDFDDVEVATMLGVIAGVALDEAGTGAVDPPSPAKLGADLGRLAEADPTRYAALALVVEALLAS